jgi:hypothetical protein
VTEPEMLDHELSEHTEDQYPTRQVPDDEMYDAVDQGSGPVDAGLVELGAMQTAFAALAALTETARHRAMMWLIESLGITGLRTGPPVLARQLVDTAISPTAQGGSDDEPSPREFMSRKKPQSQVERIACLTYYLSHYRAAQHLKASDIANLNTEAAGQKFGNLSRDIDNADRRNGYIVSAGKGVKQLTTRGEAIVEALPDREAVKRALQEHSYRAKRSAGSGKKASPSEEDDR